MHTVAAKGNTLLNYCGVKNDLIFACADKASSKQGKYMPGSHIPIISPKQLAEEKPDAIIILPWNLTKEVLTELRVNQRIDEDCEIVRFIPNFEIL